VINIGMDLLHDALQSLSLISQRSLHFLFMLSLSFILEHCGFPLTNKAITFKPDQRDTDL